LRIEPRVTIDLLLFPSGYVSPFRIAEETWRGEGNRRWRKMQNAKEESEI
jgi:hypothetical protein